jgi:hypothetical protein
VVVVVHLGPEHTELVFASRQVGMHLVPINARLSSACKGRLRSSGRAKANCWPISHEPIPATCSAA